ncbi:MAG: N-acetyl-gamma-glutamyl-phosphate reductase [Acidobacteriia bacterium]|nr:N-acetyl-gamma-glutamyl-phosphate reductase [Terriglobia bacterium]
MTRANTQARVSIVGGSGYTGGETLRLLLDHPQVEVTRVTSESNAGKFVHSVHPNLRRRTALKFESMEGLKSCDLLFLCLPHGEAMKRIEHFASLAPKLIDLSADFRLRQAADYDQWYGHSHAHPQWLGKFVYGIPELHREEIKKSNYVTGAGCLATAAILSLYPLFKAGAVNHKRVFIEAKVGSSAAGNKASLASHHPERSGSVRSFEPTGHRHTAEMIQELSLAGPAPQIYFSATAIEAVRGILSTSHVFVNPDLEEKEIWKIYRGCYEAEPFIRIVKERSGVYRYPEPKLLIGSNYCDMGFELEDSGKCPPDESGRRLVVMAAIDNLMKGAAGNAVQAMNLMLGFDETTGLGFPGLHPV